MRRDLDGAGESKDAEANCHPLLSSLPDIVPGTALCIRHCDPHLECFGIRVKGVGFGVSGSGFGVLGGWFLVLGLLGEQA